MGHHSIDLLQGYFNISFVERKRKPGYNIHSLTLIPEYAKTLKPRNLNNYSVITIDEKY